MKNKYFKYGTIGLCGAIITGGTLMNTMNQSHAVDKQEIYINNKEASASLLKKAIDTELNTNQKVSKAETVYVFTNKDGSQNHILVNEKLKNKGNESIEDQSSLQNIINVSGDESFTQNQEHLTWNTMNKSIIYQGTTNKQAPISMKITYKLDGKDISPEELAHKSGRVTIRYDYINNETKYVTIDGKRHQVHVPFTMITGLILPSDHFTNITVTNGKLSETDDQNIALGITMPGLKDSLDLKSINLDIPEYFEVSADVVDFELDASMSVATSNLFNDMNVDDINMHTLTSKMNELSDASNKLSEGTITLQAGTQELYNHIPSLQDGINQLDDASGMLCDATRLLADGSMNLNTKTDLLSIKTSQLYDTLLTNKFDQNIQALHNGASRLNQGINIDLMNMINTKLKEATAIYQNNYDESYQLLINSEIKKLAVEAYCKDHHTNSPNLSDPTLNNYIEAINNNKDIINQITSSLNNKGITNKADISNTNQVANISGAIMKAYASLEAYDQDGSMLQDLTSKIVYMNQASATYSTLNTSKYAIDQSGLTSGIQQLDAGLTTLQKSIGSFDQYQEGTLCSSLYSLKEATTMLKNEGTSPISQNLTTLANKSVELKNGTSTLKDASFTLGQGITALNDGAITLKNGMLTFNETGIQSLTKLVGTDATNMLDSLKAIVKAGQEYQSFAGKNEQMDGHVTFIYKSEDIR